MVPPAEETVEGYRTTGRRTPVNAHVWVARSSLPGRPWLRFEDGRLLGYGLGYVLHNAPRR